MPSIYTATFAAVSVSAAQDVFEILAPSPNKVAIREIRLGQYTDFGDAEAELISVQLIVGHTTTGSGGSTINANNVRTWSGAPTDSCTVKRNNTTVASAGTGISLIADTFNVAAGWWYRPPQDERIILDGSASASARLVCRITAPDDAVTMNGTLVFEESPDY